MTVTLDECRRRVAEVLEEIFRDNLDDSIARMIGDGLSDETIAAFERTSGQQFEAARTDVLAEVERAFRSMMEANDATQQSG